MGERENVGYVGVLDDLFVPMLVFEDPTYYIPIFGSLQDSPFQLSYSRSAVGDMLLNRQVIYSQVYFKATRNQEVEDGWDVTIYDKNGTFKGYLQFESTTDDPNDDDNETPRLVCTLSMYSPTTIVLTPLEPSGYGSGALLSGIRYSITSTDGTELFVPITNEVEASGVLDGLYQNANSIVRLQSLTSAFLISIPLTPAQYLSRTPPSMGLLAQPVGISQCITIADSGYGNSNYCNNWQESRGFARDEDVRDIIYYYSQDGTCGQSYSFEGIEVTTSIGDSCDDRDACSYVNEEFRCTNDGIFTQGWFWALVFTFILLVVLLALVATLLK